MSRTKKEKIDMAETLRNIGDVLSKINSRLEALEKPQSPVASLVPPPSASSETGEAIVSPFFDEDLSKYPVPPDYRTAVDEILSPEFDVFVKPSTDSPTFQLFIIVPEKYSNMPGSQRSLYKNDVRARVLSFAAGVEGVREYAKKVAQNLGSDVCQRIVADKAVNG